MQVTVGGQTSNSFIGFSYTAAAPTQAPVVSSAGLIGLALLLVGAGGILLGRRKGLRAN